MGFSWTKDEEEILKRLRENDPTLKFLYLEGEMIGAEGAGALADVLKTNTVLTKLRLDSNDIGVEGARAVANILEKNSTITKLILTDNDIGEEGVTAVANALEKNKGIALTELGLACNNIGDKGARPVANALGKNSTLTFLDVGVNKIGNDGAKAIANALEKNKDTALRKLRLDGNIIGDEGARAVANALVKKDSIIAELQLWYNKIGDDGARALAAVLKNNTALTKLDLQRNDLTVKGAKALADGLENNSTLTELRFDGTNCPFRSETRIEELLERNKRLQEYDIVDHTDYELVFGDVTIEELDEFMKQALAEPLDTEPPESPNKRPRVDEGPPVSIGDPNGNENEMEHQNRLPASSNEHSLENDILQTAPRAGKKSGGGRKYQFHAGNMRLNQIMVPFVEAYQAGSQGERSCLVTKILARVKEAGGRFLKQQPGGDGKDVWVEQTEKEVRDKISRRFKDFRNKLTQLEGRKSKRAVASLNRATSSFLGLRDDEFQTHYEFQTDGEFLSFARAIPCKPYEVKASDLSSDEFQTFVTGTDPNHPGDVQFRQMVRERYQEYQKAGWDEKSTIETELCSQWKDAGGRFMKSIENDWCVEWWVEQTEEEILLIITSVFTDIEEQMQRTPWQMSEEPDPFVPEEAAWPKIMLAPPL